MTMQTNSFANVSYDTFFTPPQSDRFTFPTTKIVYIHDMWNGDTDKSEPPTLAQIQASYDAHSLQSGDVLWIDIEHWDKTADPVGSGIKYRETYKRVRSLLPEGVILGAYQEPFTKAYWPFLSGSNDATYEEMIGRQTQGIRDYFDFQMPAIYWFYGTLEAHRTVARETIKACRRIAGDLPIRPFIWGMYHGGGVFGMVSSITSISKSSTCRLTTSAGRPIQYMETGDYIALSGVGGMAEINDRYYIVVKISDTEIDLYNLNGTPVDSTLYADFTTGGTIENAVPPEFFIDGVSICRELADGDVYWGDWLFGAGKAIPESMLDQNPPWLKSLNRMGGPDVVASFTNAAGDVQETATMNIAEVMEYGKTHGYKFWKEGTHTGNIAGVYVGHAVDGLPEYV